MSRLREFGVEMNVAEFDGMADEDLDDLCEDLFGPQEEQFAERDDSEDEADEEGGDELAQPRRSAITSAARHRRAADERVENMRAEEALEKELGFTQPVRRRVIELRRQREHDWWLSSAWSRVLFCEEDHADAIVLGRIDQSLSRVPPPTSMGRVFELPKRISSIVFEPWVAHTTTEVNDTNTVATFYTGLLPDLTSVAHRSVVLSFNLRRFAACKTTMEEGTILLFCGSAVCTGPKGPAHSNAQCQRYVLFLNQLGIPATMQGYRLQNLVSKALAGWEIDLNAIHNKYPFNAQYKPVRFPGVIFRLDFEDESVVHASDAAADVSTKKEDQIVLIFFQSSKTIITGSRTRAKTRLVWTWVQANILREFKKINADVHVSEAEYRRAVAQEESIIEHTCRKIWHLNAERSQFDMFTDHTDEGTRVSEATHAAAAQSRKRSYADAIGDTLLNTSAANDDDDDVVAEVTPITRYINERSERHRMSGEQFVADWLAKNEPLIKKEI